MIYDLIDWPRTNKIWESNCMGKTLDIRTEIDVFVLDSLQKLRLL